MEDARRIPDEATGMNASDCSVGSNLNGSGISRQTFVSLTAEGPDGICFDAHCADDSSADTTESNWTVSMGQMGGCFASGLCLCGPVHVSSSSRAILRLRHKGVYGVKKALYGIVTQRLTDDLWSTTSHELDPPMAIRSTGICPIHLVLNKRNRSFFTNQYDCDRRSHGRGARQRQTVMQLQEENGK